MVLYLRDSLLYIQNQQWHNTFHAFYLQSSDNAGVIYGEGLVLKPYHVYPYWIAHYFAWTLI